jgi:hypothetical protein
MMPLNVQQPRTIEMAPQKYDVPAPPPSPMIHMSSAPPAMEPQHRYAEPPMPQSMPQSFIPSAPIPEPPKKGIPAWLFWTFLVISFCFAGGIAAALLTHFIQ